MYRDGVHSDQHSHAHSSKIGNHYGRQAVCIQMSLSVSVYLTPNKMSISMHTYGLLVVTIMVTKRPWTI